MNAALDAAMARTLVDGFFECVGHGEVEIYNEFSLQHELGIHLRSAVGESYKVQFERPVGYFGITGRTEKREIDIAVYSADAVCRAAVELKFPRAGQYPEQMFSACRDLAFLEDLVSVGFTFGLFVIAVDDPLFYSGSAGSALYATFRGASPFSGTICKPT